MWYRSETTKKSGCGKCGTGVRLQIRVAVVKVTSVVDEKRFILALLIKLLIANSL